MLIRIASAAALAGACTALAQAPSNQAAGESTPPGAAGAPTAPGSGPEPAFVPSEQVTADTVVAFPVDI